MGLLISLLKIEEIKNLMKKLTLLLVQKLNFRYFNSMLKFSKMLIELKEGRIKNEDLIMEQMIEVFYHLNQKDLEELLEWTVEVIIKWMEEIDVEKLIKEIMSIHKENMEEYFKFLKTIIKHRNKFNLKMKDIEKRFKKISPELKKELTNFGNFIDKIILKEELV
jgi:hypothetical protein